MSNKKLFMVQTQADLSNLASIPEGSMALVYDEDLIYEYKNDTWNEIGSFSEADLKELKELIAVADTTANEAKTIANETEAALQAFLTGVEDSTEIIDTLIEIQEEFTNLKNQNINADNILFTKDILMSGDCSPIGHLQRDENPFNIIPTKGKSLQWLTEQIFTGEEKQPSLITTTELGIQYNGKNYTDNKITLKAETGTQAEYFTSYCIPKTYEFEYGQYDAAYKENKQSYLEEWTHTKPIQPSLYYFTISQKPYNIEIPNSSFVWDDLPTSDAIEDLATGTPKIKSPHNINCPCYYKDTNIDQIDISLGLRIRRNTWSDYWPATNLGNEANFNTDSKEYSFLQNDMLELPYKNILVNLQGYRNIFYGAFKYSSLDKEGLIINSNYIRSLQNRKEAKAQNIQLNINEPSNYFIIAIPNQYTLNKATKTQDSFTSNVEFKELEQVSVEGASEGYAINYRVYSYSAETNYNNLYLTFTIK